jgi:hypothetical protein
VDLANLGSESETCIGSRVHLVGAFISFEKNFYRLPFTPPPLVRCIGPSILPRELSEIWHFEPWREWYLIIARRIWCPVHAGLLLGLYPIWLQ